MERKVAKEVSNIDNWLTRVGELVEHGKET